MLQKGDPYTKLFWTLYRVILMSCILSQLNVLCNNRIKPYFTKMMTHPNVVEETILLTPPTFVKQPRTLAPPSEWQYRHVSATLITVGENAFQCSIVAALFTAALTIICSCICSYLFHCKTLHFASLLFNH